VFCVEPAGKELQQSLLAGRPMWTDMELLDTLADGARVKSVGDKCFPIIHRYCQHTVLSVVRCYLLIPSFNSIHFGHHHLDFFLQTDAEIGPAMRLLWSRLKVGFFAHMHIFYCVQWNYINVVINCIHFSIMFFSSANNRTDIGNVFCGNYVVFESTIVRTLSANRHHTQRWQCQSRSFGMRINTREKAGKNQ
jgi:hypothetical protein